MPATNPHKAFAILDNTGMIKQTNERTKALI